MWAQPHGYVRQNEYGYYDNYGEGRVVEGTHYWCSCATSFESMDDLRRHIEDESRREAERAQKSRTIMMAVSYINYEPDTRPIALIPLICSQCGAKLTQEASNGTRITCSHCNTSFLVQGTTIASEAEMKQEEGPSPWKKVILTRRCSTHSCNLSEWDDGTPYCQFCNPMGPNKYDRKHYQFMSHRLREQEHT